MSTVPTSEPAARPSGRGGRQQPGGHLDVARVRADFPILARSIHGKPLVYLDNAATTQKPRRVIEAMSRFYATSNSNVHRGVHTLSEEATAAFEAARERVRSFVGAREAAEIVFVRGATEAINLVASAWGGANVAAGDEILVTEMEHHSNIVPWQMLCERTGAKLVVAPVDERGDLELDELERRIGPRTKLVAVVHVSNALGTVNPIERIVAAAHAHGARVLVDGAQAVPHMPVDVEALGCDFYAFSGHKVYGPTGIGVLYGKREILEIMPPYQGGGEMILSVTFEKTVYNVPPHRFEAGTPDIAGAVGLGAALDYLEGLGIEEVARHEHDLLGYARQRLLAVEGLRLIGDARRKAAVHSFVLDGVHPHDIGTVLDDQGVAVRTGHHCAQPVMQRFGVPATARASFAVYNTREEVDRLIAALEHVREVFG